ncbi:hypothetical protein ACFLZX_01130 [Nanoarchaeota archaeon]
MVEFNKDELLKLKPAARLKKLKDIEEQGKKETEELSSLIKKSQKELKEESNVDVDVPPIEEVDISHLFGGDEGIEAEVDKAPISVDFDVAYSPSVDLSDYKQIAGYQPKLDVNLPHFQEVIKYKSEADTTHDISTATQSSEKTIKKYGLR